MGWGEPIRRISDSRPRWRDEVTTTPPPPPPSEVQFEPEALSPLTGRARRVAGAKKSGGVCPPLAGPLTDLERDLIRRLGSVADDFGRVLGEGRTRVGDWEEAAFHIHALQRMIGSNAAARCYPTEFRLLGGPPLSRE